MERVIDGVRYKLQRESFERFDYAAIEQHLEEMASQGWFLEKIDFFWEYRQDVPARKKYAVTYVDDYSDSLLTEGQQELDELCEQAGWKRVAMWEEVQIYCSDEETPIPIETDEWSRLLTVKRAMKKRFAPQLFCMIMWSGLLYMRLSSAMRYPELSRPMHENLVYFGLMTVMILHMGFQGTYYIWWSRKSAKSINMGGDCADVGLLYNADCVVKSASLVTTAVFIYILSEDLIWWITFMLLAAVLIILDWPKIKRMASGKWSDDSSPHRVIKGLYFAGIISVVISMVVTLIMKILY